MTMVISSKNIVTGKFAMAPLYTHPYIIAVELDKYLRHIDGW